MFVVYWETISSHHEKEKLNEQLSEQIDYWEPSYIEEEYKYFVQMGFHENLVVASIETQKYQCDHFSGNISELLRFKFGCVAVNALESKYLEEINLMLAVSSKYLDKFLDRKTPYSPEEIYDELPKSMLVDGLRMIRRYHFHD